MENLTLDEFSKVKNMIINEYSINAFEQMSYVDMNGKRIYYKEIMHPDDFIELYKNEKSLCEFTSAVITATARPFIIFPAKARNLTEFTENAVVLLRICKDDKEAEYATKIYAWGKICIPKIIIETLEIESYDEVRVNIIAKEKSLDTHDSEIDLAQLPSYNKSIKIIPRANGFITIYYKQKTPITLPRTTEWSFKLVELLFLVHGDGHYAYKLYFANKSPELHNFVLNEFENIFRVPKSAWRVRILLHDLKHESFARAYWQNMLNFKDMQFYASSKSKFNTELQGNLRIIIDKTIVSLLFRYIFDKVKKDIKTPYAFHALNGLLSAEGGAQIDAKGLHRITLSYNLQEKALFQRVLSETGIMNLCKDKQNKMFVIEGWNNLYQFLKISFFNKAMPFDIHIERKKRALNGFLEHSFTKTMIKYLSVIDKKDTLTVKNLSQLLKIRHDSILSTLKKQQYAKFIKIEGMGLNRNPFVISITEEGENFLKLVNWLEQSIILAYNSPKTND